MKKSILTIAVLTAGIIFAADDSIVSSTVVGYQNKTVNSEEAGGYTWVMSTLPTTIKDMEKLTLSSWKVTPPEGGLWSVSSVRVNTFDAAGQIAGDYCYLDDVQSATFGVGAGWYTAESVDNWEPLSADTVVIPFGEGVQIGSDSGATVTFAGEVLSSAQSFNINDESAGGYTWTGNCSPADLTLADFAITPPEGGLWSVSSVRVNTFDAAGQIAGDYCYLDDVQSATFGVDAGWYTAESVDNWEPVSAGDVSISTGEMFQIGSDSGAVITVPAAL